MNSFAVRARIATLACALLAIRSWERRLIRPLVQSLPQCSRLALQHSGVMGIAAINQWRARKPMRSCALITFRNSP